jgi:hypothetical protein
MNVVSLPLDVESIVRECRSRFPDPRTELVSVQTARGLFVLRSPTTAEHRAFLAALRDDNMRSEATRNLFAAICVHPGGAEVTSLLDRFGGLLAHAKIQNALAWLTGQVDELQGKVWPAP